MIKYDIQKFLEKFNILCKRFFPEAEIKIIFQRLIHIKIRVILNSKLFMDVYFNSSNNRFSFALIKNNKRVFGIDNLAKLHYHPLNNPEKHIPVKNLTINEIFKMHKEAVKKIQKQK